MILDPSQLVLGYPFIAARHRRVAVCDAVAVHGCCLQAAELAGGDPKLEPAAMFFAFASRRRAFPFAWKLMADFILRAQARVNGFTLLATRAEIEALCIDVLYKKADWESVRGWTLPRLVASPGL
jgi:hypothetical protein